MCFDTARIERYRYRHERSGTWLPALLLGCLSEWHGCLRPWRLQSSPPRVLNRRAMSEAEPERWRCSSRWRAVTRLASALGGRKLSVRLAMTLLCSAVKRAADFYSLPAGGQKCAPDGLVAARRCRMAAAVGYLGRAGSRTTDLTVESKPIGKIDKSGEIRRRRYARS